MLVITIFSFSHNVSYASMSQFQVFIHINFVIFNCLQFGLCLKFGCLVKSSAVITRHESSWYKKNSKYHLSENQKNILLTSNIEVVNLIIPKSVNNNINTPGQNEFRFLADMQVQKSLKLPL